eukprot:SAG31_NODE_100_length_25264_cov_38.715359_4_plen_60_part_00
MKIGFTHMKTLIFLNPEMDLAGSSIEHKVGSALILGVFYDSSRYIIDTGVSSKYAVSQI